MYLTNEWYLYSSSIDKETCNKLKVLGENDFKLANVETNKRTTNEERITGRKKEYGLDKKIRISEISWTNEQWVIDLVWPYMMKANEKTGWNFDIRSVEKIQITKYKPGGFYSWHKDGYSDCLSTYNNPDNKFLHGYLRKLSMTIFLNENYQGGEFQFSSLSKGKLRIDTPDFKNAGSVIVFPSFMEHRVAPVTKGTRYSLVAWFVGPSFV